MKKRIIDTVKLKANRLIQLRKIAKLDRNEFAKMSNVSVLTYKGWENARFGGIPLRRAELLADALQSEGIKVIADWIIGTSDTKPRKTITHRLAQFKDALKNKNDNLDPETIEELRIKAELEFFCNNNNRETISLTIPDDAMEPYFTKNDLVAGVKIEIKNPETAIGLNCIVRTTTNKLLLRQLQKGKEKNLFTLLALNQNSKQEILIQDIELIEIAPVIWTRKPISSIIG